MNETNTEQAPDLSAPELGLEAPAPPPASPASPASPATKSSTRKADAPGTGPAVTASPSPTSPAKGTWWWGTGRRKTAVARVRIRPGSGAIVVNERPYEKFFTEDRDRKDILEVLKKTGTDASMDVHVTVHGGGYTGQAGAIILGIGRALGQYDSNLLPILRDGGFLTRDSREVERKKYGQSGARRRFQFSKR